MAAIVPGGGTGSSNLPLDDADDEARALLRDAEHVAVHGVPVGAIAISRTSEREIRDYGEYSTRGTTTAVRAAPSDAPTRPAGTAPGARGTAQPGARGSSRAAM